PTMPSPINTLSLHDALPILFASSGQTARARYFAPEVGVSEDPATGSAAGPLGAFCREHDLIQEADLTIHQGDEMGRPSVLRVEVDRKSTRLNSSHVAISYAV